VLRLPAKPSRTAEDLRSCSIDLPGVGVRKVKIRELSETERGLSLLKIKLPVSTAPGVYKGTLDVAGTAFPIEVNVEASPDLRLFPANLSTAATPGSVINQKLTVLNKGNFPVKLDKEYTFCVFERGGIDRALFLALASDKFKGDERLNKLLDELAVSHGGLIRVEIASGDAEIGAGAARDIQIALRLSDRLRPGHTYAGAWKFEHTSFGVEIEVRGKIQETPR